MPAGRAYEIRLEGTLPPDSVRANGADVRYAADEGASGWRYDGATLTTIISIPPTDAGKKIEVVVKAPAAPDLLDGARGRLARLRSAMDVLNTSWPNGWSPDVVIHAAQAGRRMTLDPSHARAELEKLAREMPAIEKAIVAMDADCRITTAALARLGRAARCVATVEE